MKVKKLRVKITYEVGLGNINIPDEVAEQIAEMYRRGEVWTIKKPINVKLIEYTK